MTNREVCKLFWDNKIGSSNSMSSTGDKLYSYDTVIMQREGDVMIYNTTKYSATTSKHQAIALRVEHGISFTIVSDVPIRTKDLVPWIPQLKGE